MERRPREEERQASGAHPDAARRRTGGVHRGRRTRLGGRHTALRLHGQTRHAEPPPTGDVVARGRWSLRNPHGAGGVCALVQVLTGEEREFHRLNLACVACVSPDRTRVLHHRHFFHETLVKMLYREWKSPLSRHANGRTYGTLFPHIPRYEKNCQDEIEQKYERDYCVTMEKKSKFKRIWEDRRLCVYTKPNSESHILKWYYPGTEQCRGQLEIDKDQSSHLKKFCDPKTRKLKTDIVHMNGVEFRDPRGFVKWFRANNSNYMFAPMPYEPLTHTETGAWKSGIG